MPTERSKRKQPAHSAAAHPAAAAHSTTACLAVVLSALLLTLLTLVFRTGEASLGCATALLGRPLTLLLNLLPVLLLALLCYFATGRAWLAALLSAAPVLLLTYVNYYKILLRNDPLLMKDLTLVTEATNILGRYTLRFEPWTLIAALTMAALIVLLARLHWQAPRARVRLIGSAACACALCGVVLWVCPNAKLYTASGMVGVWAPTQVYADHGVVYPFLNSLSALGTREPEGYDAQKMQAYLAGVSDAPLTEAQKPSVVAIMLEAFSDLSGQVELERDPYADLNAIRQQALSGRLVTNIFAGGTAFSERSFLTGSLDSISDLRQETDSYVWYFKRQGYTTCGNHPWYSWYYNRRNVNTYLGFDRFRFLEDRFSYQQKGADGAQRTVLATDDRTLMDAILEDVDSASPVFCFNVSYQNHGPYETAPRSDTPWVRWQEGYDPELYAIANNYFEGVADTCAQLRYLTRQLDARTEPVVLIAFGDHKPWLGDKNSVYEMLGISLDPQTETGFHNYYDTPYFIWFNRAAIERTGVTPGGDGPAASPYSLMSLYFQLLGAPGDAYAQRLAPVLSEAAFCNDVAYGRDSAFTLRGGEDSPAVRLLCQLSYARINGGAR